MKKLITLCTFALLLGFTAKTFAADIVIKNVKIKKRNVALGTPKYPQEDSYSGFMTVTKTTETELKTGNYTSFAFEFGVDIKREAVGSVSIEIEVTDCNGKAITKAIDCKPNARGLYEGNYTVPSTAECTQNLTSAIITAKTTEGAEVQYEAKLDKKDKEKDPCKEDYKLKEISYLTDNVSGMYVMNFSFAFEKGEDPDAVSMRVRLTDCKGATMILVIKLGYDAKSGQYVAGQAIPQNKECPWVLTYGEVYGTNPCGEQTTWATDFGNVKTTGAGTRTTASSTKSTRPELQ